MKISNLDDLTEFLKFYFSEDFRGVEGTEEEKIKEVLKKSIKDIDGAVGKIKSVAIGQLSRAHICYPNRFQGNSKLILFIVDCLSEEDRKDLIIRYLNTRNNIHGVPMVINAEILLKMLDFLPDGLKVNALTNAKPVDLVRIMGEIHNKKMEHSIFKRKNKYYKKYYEIFKQALAE